jgi:hypothetical protein
MGPAGFRPATKRLWVAFPILDAIVVQMGYQSRNNTDWRDTFTSLQGIKWMFFQLVDNTLSNS